MVRSPRRTRRTSEQIAQIVRDFRDSGLTKAEFARLVGVHPNTVGYWIRRHTEEVDSPQLVPVRVRPETPRRSPGAGIELVVQDDLRIRLERGFDEETLLALLSVLKNAC